MSAQQNGAHRALPNPGAVSVRAQAKFQRALALHNSGRLEPAIDAYAAAIRMAPNHADAHHNMAAALATVGRSAAAIAAWKQAVRLRPGQTDSVVALGQALLHAGQTNEAAVLLTTACQRHPADARILALNGRALLALGQTGPAIGALFLALELQPGHAHAHASLSTALFDSGDLAQALVHGLEAFRLTPSPLHASTLSCVLIALGRYQEALAVAEQALDQDAMHFEALVNRAIALEGLGRYEDAVTAGQQAVAAAPGKAVPRMNLAVTLLSMGRLTAEAWDLYEWRLLLNGEPPWLSAVTRWDGEDIAGRTILLHAEQGLGDTLQFVRYAPLVAARSGGKVVLAVQPALARLMRAVPGVDQVVAVGDPLPHFDVVCPLLSVPRLLGTTLDTIPPALPYADSFAPRAEAQCGLRVGLVWAGNPDTGYDRQRSLDVADLLVLAGTPGVQFYSLQRHEPGQAALPAALGAIDLMAGVRDFADTAALMAGLDLVISVDTAVAHLAATMGKPVWLLSRHRGCWRWLLDRADSPWYPSVRIVRQERPNDWQSVIKRIRQDLAALTHPPLPESATDASPPLLEAQGGSDPAAANPDVHLHGPLAAPPQAARDAGPALAPRLAQATAYLPEHKENSATQPYVLAFVGESGNGMLRWWTEKILLGMARHGLSHRLIDLQEAGWRDQLGDCMAAAAPEFCFSFQGFGMDLSLNGENFWTRRAIPFLSYLGDNPYHAPGLHAAEGPGMYLLYSCADFHQTYQRLLNGRAYASTLGPSYPENPLAGRTPWQRREHGIVFVKSGVDPEALRSAWTGLPAPIRDILHDSAARVLTGVNETVATLCARAFTDRGIHCGDRRELLLFACSAVDRYARAVRAERMVQALMRHDALIVGDWSHLDQSAARARFSGPVAADRLDALYAETKIVVNTSPTVRFGLHERIMAGLLAKAVVVSDSTPYLQRTLRGCPAFLGVDIDQAGFSNELDHVLASCLADPATPDRIDASAAVARELFSMDGFIQGLLDHVRLEQHRKTLGSWMFPPARHQPFHPATS